MTYKKKGLVSASPSADSATRHFYDIGTLIVAAPNTSIESILHGISQASHNGSNALPPPAAPINPPDNDIGLFERAQVVSSVVPTKTPSGGTRVRAPFPIKKEENGSDLDAPATDEGPLRYTYPGKTLISENAKFCPDCGLRLTKHEIQPGRKAGKRVECFVCPTI